MVTRDGVVKVADFGLARAFADAQITEAGNVIGTVQYLAPEQLQGEPADPRTDLYALGVVAFELLTGRLPFTGETPMAIAYQHIHEPMPRPSSANRAVPASLDGWVASVTEKQRELGPSRRRRRGAIWRPRRVRCPPRHPSDRSCPRSRWSRRRRGAARFGSFGSSGRDRHDPGRDLGRSKRKGRKARWALVIVLALLAIGSAAWASWTYLIPHEVDVPKVVGLTVQNAQAQLEDAGLVVRMTEGRHSTKVPEGSVLEVHPVEERRSNAATASRWCRRSVPRRCPSRTSSACPWPMPRVRFARRI